jgi:uncharacterized protein YkvS
MNDCSNICAMDGLEGMVEKKYPLAQGSVVVYRVGYDNARDSDLIKHVK